MQVAVVLTLILINRLVLLAAESLSSSHRCLPLSDGSHNFVSNPYSNILPPRPKQVSLSAELRQANMHKDKVEEAVLFLDLDKTALFGNDGNDFGMALQWMEKPHSTVSSLYKRLINPNLRPAYDAMLNKAKKVHVVLYTRRIQIVRYSSCFRHAMLPVRYKSDWHKQDNQICFPSHVRTAFDISRHYCGPARLEEEAQDMEKALERIIAARDAIADELGLDRPPQVVVTAAEKNVERTAAALGLPRSNAWLFDDNQEIKHLPGVVNVEPLVSLPHAERRELLAFMEDNLPLSECDDDLLDFLRGAREGEEAIEFDVDDCRWRWRVPLMDGRAAAWAVPEFADRTDGTMSPVTPSSEESCGVSRAESKDAVHCRPAADLKVAAARAIELRKVSGT